MKVEEIIVCVVHENGLSEIVYISSSTSSSLLPRRTHRCTMICVNKTENAFFPKRAVFLCKYDSLVCKLYFCGMHEEQYLCIYFIIHVCILLKCKNIIITSYASIQWRVNHQDMYAIWLDALEVTCHVIFYNMSLVRTNKFFIYIFQYENPVCWTNPVLYSNV